MTPSPVLAKVNFSLGPRSAGGGSNGGGEGEEDGIVGDIVGRR